MDRHAVVLVGAGAAHLVALRRWAMRGLPAGARVTLVCPAAEEPYSGAVPAVLAGRWRPEAAVLDLARLARSAGARLVLARATALDRAAREIHLDGHRPPLRWDVLSLCPGAAPAPVPGLGEHAIPLKPLGALLERWEALARPGLRVLVAGGGAAGFEAAMAARARLGPAAPVTLLAPGEPLAGLGGAAARAGARALDAAGIGRIQGRAARLEAGEAVLEDGGRVPFDLCLWAAGAAPPAWLAASGLRRDAAGWFPAERSLLAAGEDRIFLVGDVAAIPGAARNGVVSVRQGEVLARNIDAVLAGRPPEEFQPPRRTLALLQAGEAAIAARGGWAVAGGWALRWKDRIDHAWLRSFRELAPAPMRAAPATGEMRCDGCGAKLPAGALAGALARLGGVLGGDAAPLPALAAPALATVDLFRLPVPDPWLAGRVAAAHALGDLAAAGAEPRAALAIAAMPPAAPHLLEEDLFLLLHGARGVLEAPVIGGHSAEAAEAMAGFALVGEAAAPLRRDALRPGDRLALSRPLGSGAVLAAAARGLARGGDVAACWALMARSPMPEGRALRDAGARAAADVTGFGLAGHLLEMLEASGCGAALDPLAVPAVAGALAALRAGVRSTLHAGNGAAFLPRMDGAAALDPLCLALILDPQTTGGLLGGLPPGAPVPAGFRVVGRAVAGPARIALQPGAAWIHCQSDEGIDGHHPAGAGIADPAAAR